MYSSCRPIRMSNCCKDDCSILLQNFCVSTNGTVIPVPREGMAAIPFYSFHQTSGLGTTGSTEQLYATRCSSSSYGAGLC